MAPENDAPPEILPVGDGPSVGDEVIRDDRVLPETRLVAYLLPPVLVVAFILLYGFPADTARLWAWPIAGTLTAMLMGGGYLAGAYLFARVARSTQFHTVRHAFPMISVFTATMLAATILHWPAFTPTHPAFWAWAALYLISPFLVPWLYWRNRVTDPGGPIAGQVGVPIAGHSGATSGAKGTMSTSPPSIPPIARIIYWLLGLVTLTVAVGLFAWPDAVAPLWPWAVKPLAARVVAGWLALAAVARLSLARESRPTAWLVVVQAALIWETLLVVALWRGGAELDFARPGAMPFVIWLAVSLLIDPVLVVRLRRLASTESRTP